MKILGSVRIQRLGQLAVIIHFNIIQAALLPNIPTLGQVGNWLVSIVFLSISVAVLEIIRSFILPFLYRSQPTKSNVWVS